MMMGFLMLGMGPLRQRSHYEVLAEGVGGSAAAYLENRQGEDNTMRVHLVTLRAPCRKGTTGARCPEGAFRSNLRAFWAMTPSINEIRAP